MKNRAWQDGQVANQFSVSKEDIRQILREELKPLLEMHNVTPWRRPKGVRKVRVVR